VIQSRRTVRWRRLQVVALSFVLAGTLAFLVVAADLLFDLPTSLAPVMTVTTAIVVAATAATLSPLGMPYVDRVVLHGVRLGVAGLGATGTFLLLVVGLGGRPRGSERWVLATAIVAAALVAVLGPLLWRRVDGIANELAYGKRRAPSALLEDFARRLAQRVPREEQLLQLAESLRAHLAGSRVEIWTGEDGRFERTVSLPHAGPEDVVVDASALPVLSRAGVVGDAWLEVWLPTLAASAGAATRAVPATHAGDVLGLVVVGRDAGAERFTVTDEHLLAELGSRLGLALQTMKLDTALRQSLEELKQHAAELQASRARLVAAANTERRRIERDLHDGAQQRLIAVGLKAAMASKIIGHDPARAAELIEQVHAEVKASTVDLRDLSHGIFPPALEADGVPVALGEVASRFPFRIDVHCDGVGRYEEGVEAAVYFCCLEALQNAAKHAGEDPHVVITLGVDRCRLSFAVADDGRGFVAIEGDGQGLVGMRDRIGALGGTVTVESAPGTGTVVRGSVPVGDDHVR